MNNLANYRVTLLEYYCSFNTWAKVVRYPNISGVSLQTSEVQFRPFNCENSLVEINATGGTPPYLYSLNNAPFQENNIFEVAVDSTIIFIVQDASGQLTPPDTLIIPLPDYPELQVDVLGDEVTLSGLGGVPNYHFSLDGIDYELNNTYSNLPNGFYNAYLHDNLLCYDTSTFYITNDPLNYTEPNLLIQDCTTRLLEVEATGGLPPYLFSIDSLNFQTDNSFAVPANSNVTVYIQDSILNVISFDLFVPSNEPDLVLDIIGNNLTIIATGGTPGYTYSIDGLDFQSSNQFTNLPNGDYLAIVKDALGCTSDSSFSILISSINNISSSGSILYPNPSGGKFHLLSSNAFDTGVAISVVDVKGQVVYQSVPERIFANKPVGLDLSHLSNGVYILQIRHKQFIQRHRIILLK